MQLWVKYCNTTKECLFTFNRCIMVEVVKETLKIDDRLTVLAISTLSPSKHFEVDTIRDFYNCSVLPRDAKAYHDSVPF